MLSNMNVMGQAALLTTAMLMQTPAAVADENRFVGLLPCGVYDQAVKPLVEKDLDTQSPERSLFIMEASTKSGRKLMVEVKSISTHMTGERAHVSVFMDGKPMAKTSHQDVPIYLEVHVDGEKYRVICTRDPNDAESASTGSALGR